MVGQGSYLSLEGYIAIIFFDSHHLVVGIQRIVRREGNAMTVGTLDRDADPALPDTHMVLCRKHDSPDVVPCHLLGGYKVPAANVVPAMDDGDMTRVKFPLIHKYDQRGDPAYGTYLVDLHGGLRFD